MLKKISYIIDFIGSILDYLHGISEKEPSNKTLIIVSNYWGMYCRVYLLYIK